MSVDHAASHPPTGGGERGYRREREDEGEQLRGGAVDGGLFGHHRGYRRRSSGGDGQGASKGRALRQRQCIATHRDDTEPHMVKFSLKLFRDF